MVLKALKLIINKPALEI